MADSRWSKQRYPLQAVMENASSVSPPDGELEKCSTSGLQGSHAIFSPAQMSVDDYSDGESSTAGLMSRSLTRTADEDNASSATLHSRNDLDPSRPHDTVWSAGTFHMLSTTSDASLMRSPSFSTNGSEYTFEQSLPGSFAPAHKTLKRTSRHRRVESPVPLALGQAPPSMPSIPNWSQQAYPRGASVRSVPATSKPSSPRQQLFSVSHGPAEYHDSIARDSTEQDHKQPSHPDGNVLVIPPAVNARQDDAASDSDKPPTTDAKASQRNQTWRRSVYPLQMAAGHGNLRSPPTPPPSPPQQTRKEHGEQVSMHAPQPNALPGSTSNPSAQHTQSAQHATHTGPTELAQSEYTVSAPQQSTAEEQPVSAKKSLKRPLYPLQSPASIADLHGSCEAIKPDGQISSSEATRSTGEPESGRASAQASHMHTSRPVPPEAAKKSAAGRAMRRNAYPLQSPASITNLQQSAEQSRAGGSTEPNGLPRSAVVSEKPTRQQQQPQVKAKPFKRQAYPLQAPASNFDLQAAAHNSAPANENLDRSASAEQAASATQPVGNERESVAPVSFRRHAYPLQGLTSASDASEMSPINRPETKGVQGQSYFSGEHGVYEEPASMSKPRSPTTPTSPKTPLWRRSTYPPQFIEDEFNELPSPDPSYSDDDESSQGDIDKSKKILLPRHIPAILKPEKAPSNGRTIVVCLDGTGDKFDSDNSNIVHIVSALKKDDPHQVTYYQAGIGTYSANGLSKGFAAASDMAVGSGLGLHVRDAYHFLMHAYKENDRICIFGFSRGAYTARCLAGMIHKVGLLPPRNDQQIVFAYEFYKDNSREGWQQSEDFKKAFCIDVNVYFLGCFDSVASVGFIPRQLPLSTTPTNKPRHFRHAMALDERRAKFKICRHVKQNWDDIRPRHATKSDEQVYREQYHPNLTDEEYDRLSGPEKPFDTDVLEVWFAGAHADVGGGAVLNTERHKLAQIPLRWMIRQAFECNTGILFKSRILAEYGLDVHTLWPRYSRLKAPHHGPPPSFLEKYNKSLPPRVKRKSKLIPTDEHENGEQLYHLKSPWDDEWTPEQVEDFYDAMMPINDQLIQAPTWWILEAIPVEYKVPVEPGKVVLRTGPNCGQYRGVEDAEPNLHWTVKRRMEQMGYKIQARTAKHTRWRIVV